MIIQGPRPLADITELGPTPAGHRVVLACPPDDLELWTESAAALGVHVHVVADNAVPADAAFTWTVRIPAPPHLQSDQPWEGA